MGYRQHTVPATSLVLIQPDDGQIRIGDQDYYYQVGDDGEIFLVGDDGEIFLVGDNEQKYSPYSLHSREVNCVPKPNTSDQACPKTNCDQCKIVQYEEYGVSLCVGND